MAEQPKTLWLVVRRAPVGGDGFEPKELHTTQELALDAARAFKDADDRPGQMFFVVEVPVIWPAS